MTEKKPRLVVILGPTASGKTALSVELAKALGTEIISGDSMLVYKGFDIGSAKPTLKERGGVLHHLIDVREPWESYNVTDFVAEAGRLIANLNARGKLPLLAGGTGLYVKALLEGYEFNETEGHAAYRAELEELGRRRGREYVHSLLAEADPEAAARLHPNNFRRIVRALEVQHFGGERISQARLAATDPEGVNRAGASLCYDALVLGLARERQGLYERINRRVEQMFAEGLEQEVRELSASGITRAMQAMKGIGYKETAAYLEGEMSRDEAVELIQKSTRHFAKRQMTWYRKMPYIHWLPADTLSGEELLAAALSAIRERWGA